MKHLLIKAAVSVAVILLATGVARRFPSLAGLVFLVALIGFKKGLLLHACAIRQHGRVANGSIHTPVFLEIAAGKYIVLCSICERIVVI